MNGLVVTSSYAADVIQFLSVLTGQEFYVREHREAFAAWQPRLSDASKRALAEAVALGTSPYLGPWIVLPPSAVPGFAGAAPQELLGDSERVHGYYRETVYYGRGEEAAKGFAAWTKASRLLLGVVRELEALGFREYWEAERAPAIERAAEELRRTLGAVDFDMARAARELLGPGSPRWDEITLVLCSFVAPHGVKVCGPVYLADVRYPHPNTVRQALHEVFHPPYREEEVAAELAALAGDPLVRASFEAQDPVYRYRTIEGWIEDNVVEAMAHLFAREAGFADDPVSRAHIDPVKGDYKLGAVVLDVMQRIGKAPEETFAEYFRRVVGAMPVGRLGERHAALAQAAG